MTNPKDKYLDRERTADDINPEVRKNLTTKVNKTWYG